MAAKPGDPRYYDAFVKVGGEGVGWHGQKLLHNPLCAEFGIQNPTQLEAFLRNDLPEFSMVRRQRKSEGGVMGRGQGGRGVIFPLDDVLLVSLLRLETSLGSGLVKSNRTSLLTFDILSKLLVVRVGSNYCTFLREAPTRRGGWVSA